MQRTEFVSSGWFLRGLLIHAWLCKRMCAGLFLQGLRVPQGGKLELASLALQASPPCVGLVQGLRGCRWCWHQAVSPGPPRMSAARRWPGAWACTTRPTPSAASYLRAAPSRPSRPQVRCGVAIGRCRTGGCAGVPVRQRAATPLQHLAIHSMVQPEAASACMHSTGKLT